VVERLLGELEQRFIEGGGQEAEAGGDGGGGREEEDEEEEARIEALKQETLEELFRLLRPDGRTWLYRAPPYEESFTLTCVCPSACVGGIWDLS
jgi:hypothetical protein